MPTRLTGKQFMVVAILVIVAGFFARASWEDEPQTAFAQQAGCTVIDTFSGQGSLQTQPFTTTSDEWQFTYEVTNLDEGVDAGLVIAVYNADNDQIVTSASQDQPGTNTSVVNAGAGTYYLDIVSFAGDWTVSVEDCGSGGGGSPSPSPTPSPPPENPPLEAGGPKYGPVPYLPGGASCPSEYPVKQEDGCYAPDGS